MTAQRLDCRNVDMTVEVNGGAHPVIVCLAYDAEDRLREINLVGRGKVGSGIDLMLSDLGIKLSRAIQGRNPDTGASE